ncbi:MAG: phosphoribosylformylglycinamidine synthase I [Anaerolineales bacterium]|nr:phosphoribosylformylglycinamidine synthase I [Anaerolineales bacterium]
MTPPRALILHAPGTNRDLEAAQALTLAGAQPEIVPLTTLRANRRPWSAYQLLIVPGGFSYADALGAGRLLALDLRAYFADEVQAFVDSGRPVLGICNGFQALVKAGLLPGLNAAGHRRYATLTFNAGGRFECRWVTLRPRSARCLWTRGLTELIDCPVAHGEGNFTLADPALLADLNMGDQIALTYARADGAPADEQYPANPNGSLADIAGVCNPRGNVLGLMPHPEDHVFAYQHPRRGRPEAPAGRLGLRLFENGVLFAAQL